jgi:hypothetical protein
VPEAVFHVAASRKYARSRRRVAIHDRAAYITQVAIGINAQMIGGDIVGFSREIIKIIKL